ncbi:helix-turn-helix domain-containing protein [Lactobacillus bombicola]|uniref:HTH cro/C1-type domain-containing protein n=1 Tax=Lactobacillus bombicola TaxID=1505723 RepID=A0A396SXW2_9LACO|nr:helix-turn-helix transcriptional regulator [Lactobacillus bombicola]RHW53386.1 hypothetical protein DS834_00130 [Lactobacillus bombicola]RHW54439.1 hypothetical protein DS835_05160 [Lactobacillus bombicola]
MNRIREERKRKNLTLQETVDELKKQEFISITSDALSKYERGDREPKLATWQKLADFFEVPVTYLQGISNNKKSITEFNDFADWLEAVNDTTVYKNGDMRVAKDELMALGTENVLYNFSTLFKAIFNFTTGSLDGTKYKKLCDEITKIADFSDITEDTSQIFKIGIEAKTGNKKAKETYEQISKIIDKYLGIDEWEDDVPITIKKVHHEDKK